MQTSLQRNKDVARYFLEQAVNMRRLSVLDELYSRDVVVHTPFVGDLSGSEAFKLFLDDFFAAFPDIRVELVEQIAEGEKVVNRVVYRGTNTGPLMGMPATGRRISLNALEIDRFASDGKICEHWGEANVMVLMQQLGQVPAPK